MAELPGAVLTMPFHIVFLGQRGNSAGVAPKLTYPPKNDLRPPVVALDVALNFDLSPLQAADIADPFQIAGKHDHRKRTQTLILAEVKRNAHRRSPA